MLLAGLLYLEKKDAAEFEQAKQVIAEEARQQEEIQKEKTAQEIRENEKDTKNADEEMITGEIRTEVQSETRDAVSLLFAGDVYLSSHVTGRYDAAGISGVVEETLLEQMRAADVFMFNEEFPFGTGGVPAEDKQYTFRVSPSYITMFTDMGADIVSLVNNHVLDYGQEVLRETFQTLKESEILYAGAGESTEEAGALKTIEAGGETYGFLSASRVIPVTSWNVENAQPGVFTTYDKTALVAAIEAAGESCDFLTVYVHWGIERNTTPEDYQKELAHAYIDAGADLVIGAHPHVLQGMEAYKGKLICYSLGNFIFNQSIDKTMLVKMAKQKDEITYSILPACTTGAKTQPYGDTDSFYSYLESISEGITIEDGTVLILDKE